KAERGIAHLLAEGKITPKEEAGLKALDKDELKELVSLSKRRTGITEKADRYAIRAAVLLTAAKRGPAAARELRADLIHLANTEGPDKLHIAIANYMKAGEYLEPDGDPRFDDIRGNPVREAAYRSVFLGLVRNGWTFERSPEWMLQRSCDALDHIRDRSDEQLSEPHHYYNPFRGGRVVDDTAMEKSRWKYGSKANFNLIDAKAPGFLQRRKPLSGVGPD